MRNVEGRHLRSAPATGRGNGAAHAVVDVHERQRPRGVGAGAVDKGVTRPQGRKIIADTAARLEGQAGLVHFGEDLVHRIANRGRDRAVDGRSRRLVLERPGVRGNAAGRDCTVFQRP